jgi:hypothetical protein
VQASPAFLRAGSGRTRYEWTLQSVKRAARPEMPAPAAYPAAAEPIIFGRFATLPSTGEMVQMKINLSSSFDAESME